MASASATAPLAKMIGSCGSHRPATFLTVIPAETRPTTLPRESVTGTTACTSVPRPAGRGGPPACSTTVRPFSAGAMVPTNFFPISRG
ncbi:hypothetical protein RKD20_001026 [Streptomyces sp. SLBN-8D4]